MLNQVNILIIIMEFPPLKPSLVSNKIIRKQEMFALFKHVKILII